MQCIITYAAGLCSGYRNSVLRYKFLISDINHPDILYLRLKGCENPWLLSQPKGAASKTKKKCVSVCGGGSEVTFTYSRNTKKMREAVSPLLPTDNPTETDKPALSYTRMLIISQLTEVDLQTRPSAEPA
jgi:hypothetical protein